MFVCINVYSGCRTLAKLKTKHAIDRSVYIVNSRSVTKNSKHSMSSDNVKFNCDVCGSMCICVCVRACVLFLPADIYPDVDYELWKCLNLKLCSYRASQITCWICRCSSQWRNQTNTLIWLVICGWEFWVAKQILSCPLLHSIHWLPLYRSVVSCARLTTSPCHLLLSSAALFSW